MISIINFNPLVAACTDLVVQACAEAHLAADSFNQPFNVVMTFFFYVFPMMLLFRIIRDAL